MTWRCKKCNSVWDNVPYECSVCAELDASPPVHASVPLPPPADILAEARELISGPRRAMYGPVEESFERVARVWTELLSGKLKESLSSPDVALLMAAFKLCREANKASHDNLVDAIGYLALKEQLHVKGATP